MRVAGTVGVTDALSELLEAGQVVGAAPVTSGIRPDIDAGAARGVLASQLARLLLLGIISKQMQ